MKQYYGPDYDLKEFSEKSWQRNVEVFKGEHLTVPYHITALIEELGEIAGIVKKLERGFTARDKKKLEAKLAHVIEDPNTPSELKDTYKDPNFLRDLWTQQMIDKMGAEFADLFIYMELLTTKLDINLWHHIKEKFNKVSDEMDAPHIKI